MGTPEYIAPEQAEGKRVDGRTDLYALGVVAYEILAGRVPFAGNTPQLIVAHIHSPPPPLRPATLGVPPETEAVVTRMLAKDPQYRYQTGSAFVAALHSIAQHHSITPASRSQLAALAVPPSSAGKPTIAVNTSGDTATAAAPGGLPPALAQPPQPAPAPPAPAQPPASRLPAYHEAGVRRSPPPPAPTQVQQVRRPAAAAGTAKPAAKPAAKQPAQAQRGANPTVTLVLLVLFLLIAFTLVGYILSATVFRGDANSPTPPPITVPTTAPPTPVTPEAPPPPQPTDVPIVPPPAQPQPTATPREPTPEPPTRIPDVPTPEPPTPVPPTPEPPPTTLPLPTATPEPPTAEPVPPEPPEGSE